MRWGLVISALIQDSVVQWLEFQTQHAVTVGGGGTELWGMGAGEGKLTWQNPAHNSP